MKKLAISALSALLLLSAPGFAEKKQDGKQEKPKTEKVDKKKEKQNKKKEKAAKKQAKQKAEEAKKVQKLKAKNPSKLSKKEKALLEKHARQEASKKAAAANKPKVVRPGMIGVEKTAKNEWYFELPDSLLGKDMLVTTRYVSTPSNLGKFGGEQCNEQVVYFEMNVDSTLLMRSRMTVNVADSTNVISKAINVSNENPIIGAFKAEKRKGKWRFRTDDFFNSDNALSIHQTIRTGYKLGGLMREATYVQDMKSFPTNTEVRLVKTFNSTSTTLRAAAETGKATFVLNVSFVLLPEVPMLGRYYDPRVGYFTHGYTSYSDDQQRVEQKRFISRWRLEPRPEDVEKMRQGELVEPIKPIVYYIDPATPKQWRKYLIQGVNDWQKAFERAGFKNAIYGLEWPEGEDSVMSMEDARFSMIRYLASPIANAYGPHVSDPRTGEIIESHICWYHNVMELVHDWYMVQASSIDEAARKMNYDEELMGQLIRFVSSHEVGHALGLRHNFGSSSTVPVDSLRNKAWVEANGHTPSIMDYARFNYVAQPEDGISREGIFPRINDYDLWAIEWGYKPMLDATTSFEDHQALEPMTREAQKNKRLWWGDGEGSRIDPRRQTEDLGDDPVKAGEYGIRNLKYGISQLDKWTMDEKDLYGNNLIAMHNQYTNQLMRYMGHALGYIGGYYSTYRTREQGGTIYEPTPLARQKAALEFVNKNALQEPKWLREPAYVKTMSANPEEALTNFARNMAGRLVGRMNSLNELYPIDAYVKDIVRMCFTEIQGGKLSPYRETLQRSIVSNLISALRYTEGADRGNVLLALRSIRQRANAYAGSDARAKALYAAMVDEIDRALVIK